MLSLSSLLGLPRAFAIDFSDTKLQLMEISGGTPGKPSAYTYIPLPAGLIQDGLITDQQRVSVLLNEAIEHAKPHRPRTKKVVSGLPDSQTITQHFHIDKSTNRNGLRDAVQSQAANRVPWNLQELYWDYKILPSNDNEFHEVLFAAADSSIVKSYIQTFDLAGLDLQILEPESLSLARAVYPKSKRLKDQFSVIFDIGGRSTVMVFIDAEGVRLSFAVQVAGDVFTKTIADKLGLDVAKAEERKKVKGFSDPETAPVLRQKLTPLAEAFKEGRDYLEKRRARKLKDVFLVGGSSVMVGLQEEMAKVLGEPVVLGQSPFTIEGIESYQLAVVSGLAMRAKNLSTGINFVTMSV